MNLISKIEKETKKKNFLTDRNFILSIINRKRHKPWDKLNIQNLST